MLHLDCIGIEVKSQGYEGRGIQVSPDEQEAVLIMEKRTGKKELPEMRSTELYQWHSPHAAQGCANHRRVQAEPAVSVSPVPVSEMRKDLQG